MPHAQAARVFGRQCGFQFDAREVNNFKQLAVNAHAFAGLHQALRDHAANRRAKHRVAHRLACQLSCRQGCLQGRLRASGATHGGVQRRAADETLVHQGLVVGQGFFCNFQLCLGCTRLVLGLTQTPQIFGVVQTHQDLASGDTVTFTHADVLHFGGYFGAHHGTVDSAQAARHGQQGGQCRALRHGHVGAGQFHRLDRCACGTGGGR